nr:MAG TPA: hypothetical protein [Caudoviricetes sp.]DAZ32642.1 MAG TPA: hypothetical protein [Caudoviricetes sp.]
MIQVICRTKAHLPTTQTLRMGKQKSYQVHRMPDGCIFTLNIISAEMKT